VFRRQPFGDVIRRQLELFQQEEAELVRDTEEAERAYNRAPREEAEAYYEKYADLVETGTEALADLRDTYSRRLDEGTAEEYEAAFNRAVKKRLPQFGLEIRDT
jgi:C-terminal processing protease CtpA/Prc